MQYHVRAKYGTITAYTTIKADSPESAQAVASKMLFRPIKAKYPALNQMPGSAVIEVSEIVPGEPI